MRGEEYCEEEVLFQKLLPAVEVVDGKVKELDNQGLVITELWEELSERG